MAAFKVNLEILQGETYDKTMTWKVGADKTPVDLTGCTARLQVRSFVDSTVKLLDLTTQNLGIILGGINGTIQLLISATNTAAILTWTKGVYDLEIQFANGVTVRRLMEGKVKVSKEVTRP